MCACMRAFLRVCVCVRACMHACVCICLCLCRRTPHSQRAQEVSVTGTHIRYIGEGVLGGRAACVATDGDVIAIGLGACNGDNRVCVFAYGGALLHAFGRYGEAPDCLRYCSALLFVPGGIAVADTTNHQISLFTREGAYVRRLGGGGVSEPVGLALTAHSTVVALDEGATTGPARPVCVLGPQWEWREVERRLPCWVEAPTAIALSGRYCYAVGNGIVSVFS